MPSYDVTLDFPGAVGVQNKVRVVQSFSGTVTAAESDPSTFTDGISVEGQSKVFLGVGQFTNITDVDLVLWGLSGTYADFATGTIGPITPATGETITIDTTTLTAAGGSRTSGNNNYNDTLGTAAALSQEITEAINDPLNAWNGTVTATDLVGSVLITADTAGESGNAIVLTSSDPNQLFGPWPTPTQGLTFRDTTTDRIELHDGTRWDTIGMPTGPQTIEVANAEDPSLNGTYTGAIFLTLESLFNVPGQLTGVFYVDDNTATVERIGTFPVTGSGTLTGGGLSAGWVKVSGGSFSTLTSATFLGVRDVRGYSRILLQVSAITTGGAPSLTREYRILGVDPPRLPRAHVVNKDLANLDGFSTFLLAFYSSYVALPTPSADGTFAGVSAGTASDVYKFVEAVGGDPVGIWIPSDLANRITDYVRDGSANPLKISMSNGVGTDTKSTLTSRGWSESNTGDAAIDDSTGDLRFLGGTSDTNEATLTFNYTSSLAQKRVLVIADIDVVTPSGGNTSGYMAIEGTTVQTYSTQWTWAWGGTANLTLLTNAGIAAPVGQGIITLDPFERMFGEISPGDTTTVGDKRPHRLWRSSLGRTKNDTVGEVALGSALTGAFFKLVAKNSGGTQPDFRVREFHAFILS